jgi:hypothetical protein
LNAKVRVRRQKPAAKNARFGDICGGQAVAGRLAHEHFLGKEAMV